MNERLLHTMEKDMQIVPYKGEVRELFAARLIYSALSQWIRYSIYDDLPNAKIEKSKAYILSRGEDLLNNFLYAFPECKNWYDIATAFESDTDPIRDLRMKMINAGELIECENGSLSLPRAQRVYGDEGIARVIGIESDNTQRCFFAGITRLAIENVEPYDLENSSFWNPEHFFSNIEWNECNDTAHFEFFDAHSKLSPYKSWTDKPNKNEIILGRVSLYNDLHEYYLLRYLNGKWYSWSVPEAFTRHKEERRIISYLKWLAGNQQEARVTYCNSANIIRFNTRIPVFEESYIETYCWPLYSYNDKLNYVVPLKMWDAIRKLLAENLYFKFQED